MIIDNKFCEAAVYSGTVFMGDRVALNEGGPYNLE
jgi:hypothetical protein